MSHIDQSVTHTALTECHTLIKVLHIKALTECHILIKSATHKALT